MWKINSKVPGLILSWLVTTLNVNRLNSPKRLRLPESVLKTDTTARCLQVIHFRPKDTVKVKGWNRHHTSDRQHWSGCPILDHTDSDSKLCYKRQRGTIYWLERSDQQKGTKTINTCAVTAASKYIEQTLTESKGKMVNILNGKRLKAFALRSGKIEGFQFYHCYWPLY